LAIARCRAEGWIPYPSLRVDHIKAALACAAELAHKERLVPIRGTVKFKLDANPLVELVMLNW
jgi:hypothetical protein